MALGDLFFALLESAHRNFVIYKCNILQMFAQLNSCMIVFCWQVTIWRRLTARGDHISHNSLTLLVEWPETSHHVPLVRLLHPSSDTLDGSCSFQCKTTSTETAHIHRLIYRFVFHVSIGSTFCGFMCYQCSSEDVRGNTITFPVYQSKSLVVI